MRIFLCYQPASYGRASNRACCSSAVVNDICLILGMLAPNLLGLSMLNEGIRMDWTVHPGRYAYPGNHEIVEVPESSTMWPELARLVCSSSSDCA